MLGFYACPVCGGRLDRRAGAYACPVCGKRYTAEEAVRLFRSAAEAGDPASMNRLARCYESGTGGGRDSSEAKMWRDRAFKTLHPGKRGEG